jgi:hypothetical protein
MTAGEREKLASLSTLGRETGNAIDGFLAQFARFQDHGFALQAEGLLQARPI